MNGLELELKKLIVASLMLEEVAPEGIDSEAPLFGTGLGLDSIDALELVMAIERTYGVKIRATDESTRPIFKCVRTLAEHVAANRPAVG